MAVVRWTLAAAKDLEAIHDYIGKKQGSPAAAAKLIRGIYAKCQKYASQPALGIRMDEVRKGCRVFRHKSYVAFYLPIKGGIEVQRILHGSRNFRKVFGLTNGPDMERDEGE